MITRAQITKIHALKSAIGLDDAPYRDMLADRFRVGSSKDLTAKQAAALIDEWERKAVASGVWSQAPRKRPAPKGKPVHMATERQINMVKALWDQVSCAPRDRRDAALDKLVKRICKRDSIRYLRKQDVQVMVKTLESMGAERMTA